MTVTCLFIPLSKHKAWVRVWVWEGLCSHLDFDTNLFFLGSASGLLSRELQLSAVGSIARGKKWSSNGIAGSPQCSPGTLGLLFILEDVWLTPNERNVLKGHSDCIFRLWGWKWAECFRTGLMCAPRVWAWGLMLNHVLYHWSLSSALSLIFEDSISDLGHRRRRHCSPLSLCSLWSSPRILGTLIQVTQVFVSLVLNVSTSISGIVNLCKSGDFIKGILL